MVTTVLTHEVKNYSEWKIGFDSDDSNRKKHGINVLGVYQAVENPNLITVMTEVDSIETIKAFMSNPDLQAGMEKAGIVGKPEVRLLNKM